MNPNSIKFKNLLLLLLLVNFMINAQDMRVSILGGAVVTQGSTITINAGTSVAFQITNIASKC